jgi:hypothetical protein
MPQCLARLATASSAEIMPMPPQASRSKRRPFFAATLIATKSSMC